MLSTKFWEYLWKFWIIGSILLVWALASKKSLTRTFFYVVLWLKEGLEDADGQFNSKDLWLAIFSITYLLTGFLEWAYQKPFPPQFTTTLSILIGGGVISKGVEGYFTKLKAKEKEKEEQEKL